MELHNGNDLLDRIAEFGVKAGLGRSSEPAKSPFRLYYDYAFQYPPETENRPRFRDHGIAGAMLLLKIRMEFVEYIEKLSESANDPELVGISPQLAPQLAPLRDKLAACEKDVLSSVAAIALHNIQPRLWREKHTLPYGLTLSNFRIPLFEKPGTDTMALAFLLGLSDTLQTWDRQQFKAVRVDDKTGVDSKEMSLFVQDGKINVYFDYDNRFTEPGNIPDSKFGQIKRNLADYLDPRAIDELLSCNSLKEEPLDPTSPLYITRKADEEVLESLKRRHMCMVICGPRKMGKTSLLYRVHEYAGQSMQIRSSIVDFNLFVDDNFKSSNSIWENISNGIASDLKVSKPEWDTKDYVTNLGTFFDNTVFKKDEKPLLLCFDNVDIVFKHRVWNEFFRSVRSFYQARTRYDSTWNKKVLWLLCTSSEPCFIDGITDSPFNIARKIKLKPFEKEEIREYSKRYGLKNIGDDKIDFIKECVGGLPDFVNIILNQWTKEQAPKVNECDTYIKYFRNHLNRYLAQLRKEPELAKSMLKIIEGNECYDPEILHRLESAGLICYDENGHLIPFCNIYKEYFSKYLLKYGGTGQ